MLSPDRAISKELVAFPVSQIRNALQFIKLLRAQKDIHFSEQFSSLDSLEMSELSKTGLQQKEIETIVLLLQAVHNAVHDEPDKLKGIASIHIPKPRIRADDKGKLYITGLANVPVKLLFSELSKRVKGFTTDEPRIPICISRKKGVYRLDEDDLSYEVSRRRLEYLFQILDGKQPSGRVSPKEGGMEEQSVSKSNISRDIEAINGFFMQKLMVKLPLVKHTESIGYFFDEDTYLVTREDFSTRLIAD